MPTIWGLKPMVSYDPISCDQRGRTQEIPGREFPGLSRFRTRALNRVGKLYGVSPQSLSSIARQLGSVWKRNPRMHEKFWCGLISQNMHQGKMTIQENQALGSGIVGNVAAGQVGRCSEQMGVSCSANN